MTNIQQRKRAATPLANAQGVMIVLVLKKGGVTVHNQLENRKDMNGGGL